MKVIIIILTVSYLLYSCSDEECNPVTPAPQLFMNDATFIIDNYHNDTIKYSYTRFGEIPLNPFNREGIQHKDLIVDNENPDIRILSYGINKTRIGKFENPIRDENIWSYGYSIIVEVPYYNDTIKLSRSAYVIEDKYVEHFGNHQNNLVKQFKDFYLLNSLVIPTNIDFTISTIDTSMIDVNYISSFGSYVVSPDEMILDAALWELKSIYHSEYISQ